MLLFSLLDDVVLEALNGMFMSNSATHAYTSNAFAAVGMPIFYSGAEFQLQKMLGRELVEGLIKQQVTLYRVDLNATESNFYGESKQKNFKPPVVVVGRVQITDRDAVLEGGIRKLTKGDMVLHVYDDFLLEAGIEISVGDFVKYRDKFYAIYDNGPDDDANPRRLGVDNDYYRTYLGRKVGREVFGAR